MLNDSTRDSTTWKGPLPVLHALSLAAALYGLWLLLSGHLEPLLLVLGACSTALVVFIALRMEVIDQESHPLHLTFKLPAYWVWLAWEIIKANFAVARILLTPSLPISPTVVRASASQQSELGQVIYANSITLTPGTVSMSLEDGRIDVHALTEDMARSLLEGDMDRRVTRLEG